LEQAEGNSKPVPVKEDTLVKAKTESQHSTDLDAFTFFICIFILPYLPHSLLNVNESIF
jgi:hypothetical protein